MHSGLFLPLFDQLADPALVARLAGEAEEAGSGVGLGSDEFGSEYSMTGEEVDDRRRARMLDESLEIPRGRMVG
ncbi:MAG TPA: hypothetical protein VD836_01245 [Solirubrobacteraceae bacterium]|nr:hypothetical protein [Solirubrobacteraceae bacterium]